MHVERLVRERFLLERRVVSSRCSVDRSDSVKGLTSQIVHVKQSL